MRRIELLTAFVLLAACTDHNSPAAPAPMSSESVSRLTAAERSALRAGVDPDALERLLAALPPEHRSTVLAGFFRGSKGTPVSSPDPHLHALLQEVWASRGTPVALPGTPYSHQITLALVETLPRRTAGAMIVREAGSAHDLILFSESAANVVQLHAALGALYSHRARFGHPAPSEYRIFLDPVSVPENVEGAAAAAQRLERTTLGRHIAALKQAPQRELAPYGPARTIEYGLRQFEH